MSRIYAVEYRYVTDQDEEMAKMRPSHRAFNGRLADRELLLAAGPCPGTHEALIVVRAEDEAGALALLDDDPFHRAGFIAERVAREWNPVIGRGGMLMTPQPIYDCYMEIKKNNENTKLFLFSHYEIGRASCRERV